MGRLETKHWLLIVGFLTATGSVVSGLDHWGDLLTPKVLGGLIGQLAVMLGAIFAGAPQNPDGPNNRRVGDLGRVALVLLLVLPAISCGAANPNPSVTPRTQVAQVAIEADAVIKAADAVLTGLDLAMDPAANPRLPPATGLQVVKAIREVGVQGKNLSATLTVLKAATDPTAQASAAASARQTLATVRLMLSSALSPIRDAATKNQVTQLLAGLVEALDKTQQIVDAVKRPQLQLQPAA